MSVSPTLSVNLIALANEELAEAASGYRRSRQLQILTFALSVGSIFVSLPYTYLLALATLLAQGTSWGIRLRASSRQTAGEEGRMRGLLVDALGSTNERIDLANLLNRISPRARARATTSADPDYFASKAPPSVVRLREHLQENAFWGKCLYGVAVTRYTRLLVAFTVAAVGVALVAVPLAPRGQTLVLARVVVAALSFGAALTQVNEILAWRSAAARIENVDRRLETLAVYSDAELKSNRLESLLAVFGDYCVATAATPPIPRSIYLGERDRLNRVWNDSRGTSGP